MRRKIGIDIGSANIRIASADKKQDSIIVEPSVIAVNVDNEAEVLACGSDALRLTSRLTGCAKLIYPFAGESVFVPTYVGHLLKYIVGLINVRHPDAYVSVSRKISNENEKILVDALQDAGCDDVLMIEPTYAAGCGCGIPGMGENVIIDIGASYVNMAAYSHSNTVVERINGFGGNAIDKAISIAIFRKYRMAITPSTAEQIKLNHASITANENETFVVKATKPTLGLPSNIKLENKEITDYIEPVVDDFFDEVIDMLRVLPSEPDKIVLTGGGALLHGLAPTLQSIIHFPVTVAKNPEEAIINGIVQIINANINDED